MIKLIKEVPSEITNALVRKFYVDTESGYGLATVLGFIKYHLSTSNVKLVHEKDFSNEQRYIYSIYTNKGESIGRAICYLNTNRFDIHYNIGALYVAGLIVDPID